jgi:hypothetical protein
MFFEHHLQRVVGQRVAPDGFHRTRHHGSNLCLFGIAARQDHPEHDVTFAEDSDKVAVVYDRDRADALAIHH